MKNSLFLCFLFSVCFAANAQTSIPQCTHEELDKCSDEDCAKYKTGSFIIKNNSQQTLKIELSYTIWLNRGEYNASKISAGKVVILSPNGSTELGSLCTGDVSYGIYTADKDERNPDSKPDFNGLKQPETSETQVIKTCKTLVVSIK